ncbi:MAG TPA: tetratricopeptide repeat protein [Candidatus Angelobacter sp.]|nr:tetratricopeptide repeat protein [Candidatus Angelobacter sp.]
MALGFGFNKVKVLAQAEKFVQQGKLQNAISEYEKVIKEDPKDLTVLNTIGDLYARVGNNDQASYYFKKVGDQYAQNGFAVKAIAIYKKLTKLGSYNADNTIKLAELYSQQGLFNDARVHYMQVADQLLKSGDNTQAARIFQKILELDPENAHTQAKLADLYQKLGKKDEARNIYYSAAESLYARGSYAAAEESLDRVLALDPTNTGALMLRGLIAVDAGDSQAAVTYLQQVSDLDSRPDGLRALLRAKLHTGNAEGVEAVADKLLKLHNDITGITTVAQWYVTNNHVESALRLYENYADKLFAGNAAAMQETLSPLTNRVKDNPAALATLQRLMQGTGDHAQSAEVMELQAHAAAKKGNYAEARDLYKKLSELEPENALHGQNYKQMLAKLGEDSATRILSPEEAAQALMVEELDETAPSVHQAYDPPTEKAIESALTDAELYVSYNVPAKAIPPLEAALPLAPKDVNLNQRLASLYARAERYGDAARMYQNLSEIYKELGHPAESAKYLEAARKYALRAPASPPITAAPVSAPSSQAPARATWPPPVEPAIVPEPVNAVPIQEAEIQGESSVQEFSFDMPEIAPETVSASPAMLEPVIKPVIEPVMAEPAVAINFEPVALGTKPATGSVSPAHEIDLSNEWEDMIEVEPAEAKPVELQLESYHQAAEEPVVREIELEPASATTPEKESEVDHATQVSDKIQEIQFYIAQEMWEPAKSAILDLTELAPDAPEVTELIAAVSAGQAKAAPPVSAGASSVAMAEVEETPVAFAPVEVEEVLTEPAPIEPLPVEPLPVEPPPPPPAPAAKPKPAEPPIQVEKPKPIETPPVTAAQTLELDDVLDIPEKPKAQAPAAQARKGKSTEDILGDFVLDLEQSDLADFAPKQPAAPEPARMPVSVPAPTPVVAPALERHMNGNIEDKESGDVLSDILSELQEETDGAPEPQEDPETHYNLGIAFKEMGLLDEAIGELQKVCHAVDRGVHFSQPVQALTWLAQCLVDKGAPEAAVRWYKKALQLQGLDDGSRCAIYYDLATAYEASGDKKSALVNFMEVYGSNIDFRDVASRIKALKS